MPTGATTTASPETDLERERIECVFGLGGGELHVAHPDFRDSEGWDGPDGIAYWYDGVPDYATDLRGADRQPCPECGTDPEDEPVCATCDGSGVTYHEVRTAILCRLFGKLQAPEG